MYRLTIEDEDRQIEYEVTVHGRVIREIGGCPGVCVDIDRVEVDSMAVRCGDVSLDVPVTVKQAKALGAYVEREFDSVIREEMAGLCCV